VSEQGEVEIKGLVHGGPCHLSCKVGVGDVVESVDGTQVRGDVKLAKQLFLGDQDTGVTLGLKRDGASKSVHLLRGKPVENRANKEGETCGIGATLSTVKEGLAIGKIAPGSPAQLSGELQAMDVIVSINGVDVQGKSPQDAAILRVMIGLVGTRVSLTIIRGRGSRRQVEVVRAHNLEGAAVAKAASYRYNSLVQQQTLLYPWLKRMQLKKSSKAVHGGQGTVNEVTFEGATSSIRIALKVVFQRGSSFKSAERSLWLNVDNHPHILPLLFTAGPNMLFMPFMELASVTDWLAKSTETKTLPPDDLRLVEQTIGVQVSWALQHMHKVGTLHLDMKPNNILIRVRDSRQPLHTRVHCMVCDFGLAAVNIEGSATGRGGTPGYWAPELMPIDGAGVPVAYWSDACSDPPPACRANITDKADTWMWATTMLAIMDRLDRMRTQGYTSFTSALARGDGLERLLANCLKPQPQERLPISIVSLTMQRLLRDKGIDAYKPMDEDRSVMEYARAGQGLCLALMGDHDPQTWAATERLVRVMRTHGEYREAEALCARVLERKIATEAEASSIARTQRQLGGVLDDLGRYPEAVKCFRGALEVQTRTLGATHIDVASTKDSLGVTLWRQGKLSDALVLYDEALQVRESVLGTEHVLVAKTIVNRANVYFRQGHSMRALADYSRALEIAKRTLGEEHVLVAKTKNNMAEVLRVEGKFDEALLLYRQSLDVLTKVLGAGHVLVANTKNNMAGIYLKQGRSEEALQCYLEAMQAKIKVLGNDHVDVANTVENIGVIYAQQGNHQVALAKLAEALAIRTAAVGADHPDVASTEYKMALVHEARSDFSAALPFAELALAKGARAMGSDHPEVMKRKLVRDRLQHHGKQLLA